MNHLQIAYFLAVAKYRSFSEAARQLFVAQSAISKQIQSLESSLGINLFIRANRTVVLTPAGEVMYRELQKYNDWLLQIIDMARQVDQGKAGILNIGVLHGLDLSRNKVNSFYKFFELYPGIQINIERIRLQDVSHALHMGTHDLVITYSFLVPDLHNTVTALLGGEDDQIVVSRAHPLGKTAVITPDDLREYPLVTISPEVSRYAYLNSLNYLTGIGVSPAQVTHVHTIEDIMLSVEFGLGYGIASDSSRLTRHQDSIRFVDMYERCGKTPPRTDILAMWRRDSLNPSIQFYVEYLRTELDAEIRYGDSQMLVEP